MQTEALAQCLSLFVASHVLKIWKQPSMKQGKLFGPSHFPTRASQLHKECYK